MCLVVYILEYASKDFRSLTFDCATDRYRQLYEMDITTPAVRCGYRTRSNIVLQTMPYSERYNTRNDIVRKTISYSNRYDNSDRTYSTLLYAILETPVTVPCPSRFPVNYRQHQHQQRQQQQQQDITYTPNDTINKNMVCHTHPHRVPLAFPLFCSSKHHTILVQRLKRAPSEHSKGLSRTITTSAARAARRAGEKEEIWNALWQGGTWERWETRSENAARRRCPPSGISF